MKCFVSLISSEQDVQDRKVFTVCKPLPLRKKTKPKVKKREGIMTEEKKGEGLG